MRKRQYSGTGYKIRAAITCACLMAMTAPISAQDEEQHTGLEIRPGSPLFKVPELKDYEARYNSSFSKTGEFTLQVRVTGDGKKLSMIDIIPGENVVIVAHRQVDVASQLEEFSAGPNFAWGPEFIVKQSNGKAYDWTRVSVGGGEPKRAAGPVANGGSVSEMFSPLLATLMPMEVGSKFRLPAMYARKGEIASSEFDDYEVTGRERLETASGLDCECWVIDKKNWGGSLERIWVARKAPYVFKRHRDVGGQRSFVSELTGFRLLKK